MVLVFTGPHPENAVTHTRFHPYVSEFRYKSQYHPSRNPDCAGSQWLGNGGFYERRFKHKSRRSFEESVMDQDQDHAWIEIKATLIRCSKQWQGLNERWSGKVSQTVRNCRKKVIISVKINNIGKMNTREEFVLVDHVLDPVKMHKIRLPNPYVIKIRQEPLLHLYGLRFQGIVNAEATEEIVSNHWTNFTGCDDSSDNPTCGQTLIDGEPIPFSQGFCCSCESRVVANGSSRFTAKSNYQRDYVDSARNRFGSNLFDNSTAQCQVEHKNEEKRDELKESGTRPITSHNISVVNGSLEHTMSRAEDKEEKQRRNKSAKKSIELSLEYPWTKKLSHPSKKIIEAFIDAVYDRAMKKKTMQKDNEKNISVIDNFPNATAKLVNVERICDYKKLRWRSTDNLINYGQSSIDRSIANDLQIIANMELAKSKSVPLDFRKISDQGANQKILDFEKCEESANLSKNRNREEMSEDQTRSESTLENTWDYTSTYPVVHFFKVTSRIPEEDLFSRHIEKNALSDKGNVSHENGSFTTIESFNLHEIPFRRGTNYYVTSSIAFESNDLREDASALLSKIITSDATSFAKSEERRHEFTKLENGPDHINAPKNTSMEKKKAATSYIDVDYQKMKECIPDISTRSSTISAFMELQNISFSPETSKELFHSCITGFKNKVTTIHESSTRTSLLTNKMQPFSEIFDNRRGNRELHIVYNSSKQRPKEVNLEKDYKSWMSRQKSLKSNREYGKYRRDKGIRERLKRLDEKSLSGYELRREKRELSDFKRSRFGNRFLKRDRHLQRRLRRHLQSDSNFTNDWSKRLTLVNENSYRKMRAFIKGCAPSDISRFKFKIPEDARDNGSKKQMSLDVKHFYRKAQPEEDDILSNEDKKSNADKRIEEEFLRISNALKGDSTERRGVVEKSEESTPAKIDIDSISQKYDGKGIRIINISNKERTKRVADSTSDYKKLSLVKLEGNISIVVHDPSLPSLITREPKLSASRSWQEIQKELYTNGFKINQAKSVTQQFPTKIPWNGGIVGLNRNVRQYAKYTSIGPDPLTSNEITETVTLPPENAINTRLATIFDTSTKITDETFRPSIRLLKYATMRFSEEKHDEVSFDVTTYVDETEITATDKGSIVSKWSFRSERSDVEPASNASKVLGEARKSGEHISELKKKRDKRENDIGCVTVSSLRATYVEGKTEDHPWYRTTEVQRIIAATGFKSIEKVREERKKQKYGSKTNYFKDSFSGWTSLTGTKSGRSNFIRVPSDRDSSVFRCYDQVENEENRPSERIGPNENLDSLVIIEPVELRSRIEKRLVHGMDYLARQKSFRCTRVTKSSLRKRNSGLRIVDNINARYFSANAQNGREDEQGGPEQQVALRQVRRVKDDAVNKFDEHNSSATREVTLTSFESLSSDSIKSPMPRKNLSASIEKAEMDRGRMEDTEMYGFGERSAAINGIVMVRKMTVNVSASERSARGKAGDLSSSAPSRGSTGRILPSCVRSAADRSCKTGAVIRGAKLMIASDKGETRDRIHVAAENVDKKIPLAFSVAKRPLRDASGINENSANLRGGRISTATPDLPHYRGKEYVSSGEIIGRIERGKSSSASDEQVIEKNIADREKRIDRSGRRLLSSGKSSCIENIDDEDYKGDECETNAENDLVGDNEAIAKSDDLLDLDDRRSLREARDGRKLVGENTDADGNRMPEERTIAVRHSAMISDDAQVVSEDIISSGKETADTEEGSYDFDASLEEKNALTNTKNWNEPKEEPLLFHENIANNNLREEPIIDSSVTINRDKSISKGTVDFLKNLRARKREENLKISLSGKMRINGGFNQTPMLISFDAFPEEPSMTLVDDSSNISTPIEIIVTNRYLDNANANFDFLCVTERGNSESYESFYMTPHENQELGRVNAKVVTIKDRGKFFDLAREEDERRQEVPEQTSRIEKRLDGKKQRSKIAKQVFLTEYSKSSKTVGIPRIPKKSDGEMDKMNPPRSSANSVYFPDILGSVFIRNGTSENADTVKESQRRIDGAASSIGPSNVTVGRVALSSARFGMENSLVNPTIDESNRSRAKSCLSENLRNAISGGCYRIPVTVRRRLEFPETTESTLRKLQISDNHRDDDPARTAQFRILKTTRSYSNTVTVKHSFAELRDGALETTDRYSINDTLLATTLCGKRDDRLIHAVRMRNMMAVVKFVMKLFRIIAASEEPSYSAVKTGETLIRVKNIVVDGRLRGNVSSCTESDAEEQNDDIKGIVMASERTKQRRPVITEWPSTITERIHEESLPFEYFTVPSLHPTASSLLTSFNEVIKNERVPGPFETSTESDVYSPTLLNTTSSAKPKSFLFYDRKQNSFPRYVPLRNTSVSVPIVEKNRNVLFENLRNDSGGKRFHSNDSQTDLSPSRPRDRNRSLSDRLRFGKQETASGIRRISTKVNDTIRGKSFEREPLTNDQSARFRKSSGVANDTIGPMLPRDTNISRDGLLQGLAVIKEEKSECSKESLGKSAITGLSDWRGTRMKLLNSATSGGGSLEDWIGIHRTAAQLPVDKKLKKSRQVQGVAATPEKLVFRRIRQKINRFRDLNPNGAKSDSFQIKGRNGGSAAMTKLSAEDGASSVTAKLRRWERIDSSRNDNSRGSLTGNEFDEDIANKHVKVSNKKGHTKNLRKSNRVFRKWRNNPSATREKKKWRKKQKYKKENQRTRDISEITSQWRFKRHLLMASLEPEPVYDADDATARLSRRYSTVGPSVEDLPKPARGNARGDRKERIDGLEVDPGRVQIRGGQDCTDRRHPANIDATKYLESAHCLRFSDLWYSVYQLEDPIVEHVVYLQVYEKRVLGNGSTYWENLTGDSTVRLGTFNRHHSSSEDTIAFVYGQTKMPEKEEVPNLDVARDRLLVPSSVTTSKRSRFSSEDESEEYLVVRANSINESGNECDKAGVGFAAFAGQPDRCGRVRGTCLKNQPLAYRRHDAEARAAGRPGCYFLSNFASVPSEPIKYYSVNGNGSREFLALEYHSLHVSAIDIEVRASYNAVKGPLGEINEVHVDNVAFDRTLMTVVLTNKGLASVSYRARVANCPVGLPRSWANATFPRKMIQPRRDQRLHLDLYGELPVNEFYCSVQLLNRLGEPTVTRRIKVRKMDRCSCVLHCSCVCVGDTNGTNCRPISSGLHRAAGFHGLIPAVTSERKISSNTSINVTLFLISLISLLLLTGFLKWSIGLCIPAVSYWGVEYLLGPGRMSKYSERKLKCKCAVTDENGAAVHLDTREGTVGICSRKTEFFLNSLFFLIFPFAICYYCLKKVFLPVRRRCCSCESKMNLPGDQTESPRMICVNTYSNSKDSKMEAEDTEYVIKELKKSEESLRSYSKSKGYRSRH